MKLRDDLLLVFAHSRKIALFMILVVVPCIYLLSGFYSVGSEERGIVMRFGKIIRDNVMPGMHYHFPWPVDTVQTLPVTALRSMEIDFAVNAPGNLQPELTTGNEDLVDVSVLVQYNIKEPGNFINTAFASEVLLEHVAISETLYYISSSAIDPLLTTGRTALQNHLKAAVQNAVDQLQLGMRITSVQIRRLEPPESIKKAFDGVARARSEKQKLIQESMGERNTRLAEARSEANSIRQEARGYATEVLERALGDRDHLLATLQEYEKSPQITGRRLHLEKLEEILSQVEINVIKPSAP